MKDDEKFMRLAIDQAEVAGRLGEVPVGAVITDSSGKVISSGYNLRETTKDPTAHAEVVAIKKASRNMNSWRLEGCTLYVTVEPCVMCIGAMVLSRINRLVFGARDPKAGAVLSLYKIGTDGTLNHKVDYREGVYAQECSRLLREFFATLRVRHD